MTSGGNTNFRWATACYGVDLQGDQRVIVRGERRGGHVTFTTVAPAGPTFTEARRRKIPCVACLTARESLTRWLEAPFSSARKAGKVFPTLLDIQLPFPLEECAYAFLPAQGPRRVTRALAVAAREEEVRKKLASLAAAGIDPMALDHEGLALWTQSLRETPPGPGEEGILRMVVNLRGDLSTLVIGRGGEFLSAHGIRSGDIGQIKRLLKPHRTTAAQVRWFWTGPDAQDAGKVSGLYGQLSREWPGQSSVHSEPATFLARALAERALAAGPLRCNLRSGPLTHPALIERSRTQLTRAAALFLVAGLVLCGSNGAVRFMAREREARVDALIGALAVELAGDTGPAKGDALIRIVGDKARKKIEGMRPFLNVFDPSLAATLASVADAAKRNSLHLDMLSMSRDKVQVAGAARSWNGGDELMSFLKRAGYPAKLDRKDGGADGIVPFSIASGGADEP